MIRFGPPADRCRTFWDHVSCTLLFGQPFFYDVRDTFSEEVISLSILLGEEEVYQTMIQYVPGTYVDFIAPSSIVQQFDRRDKTAKNFREFARVGGAREQIISIYESS